MTSIMKRHIGNRLVWLALPLALAALRPAMAYQEAPAPPPPPPPPAYYIADVGDVLGAPLEMAEKAAVLASGRSYLGVGVREIDAERAKALKLKEERGVELTRVEEDSPAAKAGLKAGDVVLEYNGERIEGTEQFVRMVRETPAGRQVKLLISRAGATQTVTATVAARKGVDVFLGEGRRFAIPEMPPMPEIRIPDVPRAFMSWRSSMLGVEVESIESQLAEYFGVKEGVLVRSVIKGSAAEKAGLKAGDVITKVDDTKVSSPGDVTSAVRGARSKKTFPITLTRNHKEMTLTVTLEDQPTERRPAGPRARVVRHTGARL